MFSNKKIPSKGAIKEASNFPNAWVYEIDSELVEGDFTPPHAVIGAWQVDSEGKIFGDFVPNPNYSKV